MPAKPRPQHGLQRIQAAFFYSLAGLRAAFVDEAAFRQEVVMVALAVLALPFLPLSWHWRGGLFLASRLVLVVEQLNSAIEAMVDLASPDYHPLAKKAKDMGSAAVLVSIIMAVTVWLAALSQLARHP